jgi:TadE-like protein
MATAELAVVLPAVLLVLAMCLSGLGLAVDQLRCVDAARAGARAASRGEPVDAVRAAALVGAPEAAVVSVDVRGDRVTVTVSAAPRSLSLPGLPGPSAAATAPLEPVAS